MISPDTGETKKINYRTNTALYIFLVVIAVAVVIFIDKLTFQARTVDPRVWLGLETMELTPAVKGQYDIQAASGLLVSRVFNGSPAQASGISEGDVIRRWNGISVTSPEQLQYLIQTTQLSERITITVERLGKPVSVYARVNIRPGGI